MSTSSRKRKRTRRISEEEEGTISEIPSVGVAKPTVTIPISTQLREKLGTVITELIFDAQEVGFELAMLKCENKENCPLVEKTRELIKKVRELFEIQRKITKR